MPTLEDLATETLFQIGEYLDTSSLSALCLTNKRMSNLFSPMLYTNIKSSNPVASLKLFAGLAANPEAGYIGLYRDRIRSISIEYSETTFKIKVPLLLALAKCIEQGYFPSLREFKWAHLVYYRATFDPTPHPALRYDEPLWRALLQHQPPL